MELAGPHVDSDMRHLHRLYHSANLVKKVVFLAKWEFGMQELMR
jgi:hypothetical protein